MKKIFLFTYAVFLSFPAYSQNIHGHTWLIKKSIFTESTDTFSLFSAGLGSNIFDLSLISYTFNQNGTYLGTNINGNIINGTWSQNSNNIMIDGNAGNFIMVNNNEFVVSSDFFLMDTVSSTFSIPAVSHLHFIRATPVPIELISFSGQKVGAKNQLEWKVNEKNVSKYIVSRRKSYSADFEAIGEISSNGDGQYIYTYLDESPAKLSYYRITIFNEDNTIEYSKILVLENESISLDVVKIFPTPVNSDLYISLILSKESVVETLIHDAIGVLQKIHSAGTIESGYQIISLDMSEQASGLYFVTLLLDGQKILTFKTLKN